MASYPGAVKTFTSKTNQVHIVDASHINDLQDEVNAIETELGVNVAGSQATLAARLGTINSATGAAIGIGTASPGYPFVVYATVSSIQIESATGTAITYLRFTNANGSALVGIEGGAGAELAGGTAAYSTVITSTNNQAIYLAIGAVGVAMEIAGDRGIFFANLLAAGASTDVNINGSSELHKVTSSKRFKKNIKPLAIPLEAIYQLQPKSFNWKEEVKMHIQDDFGLVAEEAAEVIPDLVNYDEEGVPYSVRTQPLAVLALAAALDLNKRVEVLENA